MEQSSWIEIEIINWEKYNPRSDRAHHSWFRLENSIATEPKFHGLSAAQKFIAICLLAEASKGEGGKARVNLLWLCDQLKVRRLEIDGVVTTLVDNGVMRCRVVTANTHNFQSSLTTNERTNERTNETNEVSAEAEPVPGSVHALQTDPHLGEFLQGIKAKVFEAWEGLYPPDWIREECLKASAWVAANPHRAPKAQKARFMTNWLCSGWERHRKTLPSNLAPTPIQANRSADHELAERARREQEELNRIYGGGGAA